MVTSFETCQKRAVNHRSKKFYIELRKSVSHRLNKPKPLNRGSNNDFSTIQYNVACYMAESHY